MPIKSNVAPPSGYQKAGSLGSDMKPNTLYKRSKVTEGLKPGSITEYTASYPTKEMSYGKKANFISDTDMGLISHEGKSGKYQKL